MIAEDVAEVNPDLVARDKDGQVTYVRYDAVNAMLLNEFLKEHKKVEEQLTNITQLKSKMAKRRRLSLSSKKGWRFSRLSLKSRPHKSKR